MYISNADNEKAPYHPGVKRWSLYRSIWMKYTAQFLNQNDDLIAGKYGKLNDEKITEVKKLIECGEFNNGFVIHACLYCGTKLVIPFTCKSRLCLSCRRKSLFGWSINLSELMCVHLNHVHVTFTIPGRVNKMIRNSGFDETDLVTLSAGVYVRLMRMSKCTGQKHLMPGMLATLHKCGNSLNYNPHVHLVGTTDLVDRLTGEIFQKGYIHYAKARHLWMHAVCAALVKRNIITSDISRIIKQTFPDGFHVYFTHIAGNNNEILGRTAEYIASGFFHNSLITEIDHRKSTVTFRYKKYVNRKSGEKLFGEKTLNVFEFMARMLYFLPEKHSKQIRWYGLYANGIREKLKRVEKKTWALAVQHSFEKNPEICPKCNTAMVRATVFSFYAVREAKNIWRTHACMNGFFIPYKNDP